MKLFCSVLIAFLACETTFAGSHGSSDCTVHGGGQSQVEYVPYSQYVVHEQNGIIAIYSCGQFMDDHRVVVTPQTPITELDPAMCTTATEGNISYLIYCLPPQ